jgi:hypothetical protein
MAPDADIYFERIAVTPEQINDWDLPTRPTNTVDPQRPHPCRPPEAVCEP